MICARFRFLLLLGLVLVTGCGIKGPLKQKGTAQPVAPAALNLAQQGEDLVLSWKIPTGNQDGTPLTDLTGFDIYRLAYTPADYCEECSDPATPLVHINLAYPLPATQQGDRLIWRDDRVAPGIGYRYRVVPVTSAGQTGAPGSSRRVVLPPPPAPTQFQVAPLDRGARLTWLLPATLPEGMELIGVQIYRALGDEVLRPVGGDAQNTDHYDDFGLLNNQSYRYGLRSVARIGELTLESVLTELVTVAPDAEH